MPRIVERSLRRSAGNAGARSRSSSVFVRAGLEDAIRERSGLPLDPYYSAGKLAWLLEHNEEVRSASAQGRLRFGTVDAWLTARLDGGDARTDTSTASRTQLLSLATLGWDDDLLGWFGIAAATLPRVVADGRRTRAAGSPTVARCAPAEGHGVRSASGARRTWRLRSGCHQGDVRHRRLRARQRRSPPGCSRRVSKRRSPGPCRTTATSRRHDRHGPAGRCLFGRRDDRLAWRTAWA